MPPKLRLSYLPDDKPVKLTLDLPAAIHRDLCAYAEAIAQETGQSAPEPVKLIAPMLERFMATDRGFARVRKSRSTFSDS